MICPKCEYQYVDLMTECPDCKEDLIPVKDFEGNLTNPEDYVVVYTTDVMYEVEMLKANLEGADIFAKILTQKDSSFPIPGNFSLIRLLVLKENAHTAVEIINDINSNKSQLNED